MTALNRLRDHPHILEIAYQITERIFQALHPFFKRIGYERADKLLRMPERIAKRAVFNCQMCGQCALHFTGMTCPMGCPKNLRNGPCGGVRVGGFCEVNANMNSVRGWWWQMRCGACRTPDLEYPHYIAVSNPSPAIGCAPPPLSPADGIRSRPSASLPDLKRVCHFRVFPPP